MSTVETTSYLGNNNEHSAPSTRHRRKKKNKKFTTDVESPDMDMDMDDKDKDKEKPKEPTSYFSLSITGQIISATFPLGPDTDFVFCRYELVAGPDWQLASGPQHGITQLATNKNGNFNDKIIFNMPIDVTYKSTSPFGWPQVLVSVFGQNGWGRERLLGYARVHLPIFGQIVEDVTQSSLQNVPILMPKWPNTLADITGWLLGREPELKDPKVLLDNLKCKGLNMESYGTLEFQLHSIMRGAQKLGYKWHT